MHQDSFSETIKLICKMASINLIRAAVAAGYIADFYNKNQYMRLESAIDQISEEFK